MYNDVEIIQMCLGQQVNLLTKNPMFSRTILFTAYLNYSLVHFVFYSCRQAH